MCETCEKMMNALESGQDKTVEERVALSAIIGAIVAEHGPETAVDMLVNSLGFVDYLVGRKEGDERRMDIRGLTAGLLSDYYATADGLVEEDRNNKKDGLTEDDRLKGFTSGTMH